MSWSRSNAGARARYWARVHLFTAIGVCAFTACAADPRGRNGSATGGGGATTVPTAMGGAGGESSPVVPCGREQAVPAPTLSGDCAITERELDPIATCADVTCAVTRVLALTCSTRPNNPSISSTKDGAVMMSVTPNINPATFVDTARLVTVTSSGSRVEDVLLAGPNAIFLRLPNAFVTTSADGAPWVFAGRLPSVTVLRKTSAGWVGSDPIAWRQEHRDAILTGASAVNDRLGYMTYSLEYEDYEPHLATWDGSCWTDAPIGRSSTYTYYGDVRVDPAQQPWVAWYSNTGATVFLRGPDGVVQDLGPNIPPDVLPHLSVPVLVVPGSTAASPVVAARVEDGILVLLQNRTEPGWRSVVLPNRAANDPGDCPLNVTTKCPGDPCGGRTTCTTRLGATGGLFGLVRTQSGAAFVAWVEYASEGTYALEQVIEGGGIPRCYCGATETSGVGTAELVVARLGDQAPVLSRFRFDMRGATLGTNQGVVMSARGDTLIMAAHLTGGLLPEMTYLEIDSTKLP